MKINLICFLFCLLILASFSSTAQETKAPATNKKIDSLLRVFKSLSSSPELKPAIEGESAGLQSDTTKINTLNALSKEFRGISNYEQSMQYAEQAKQQGEKIILLYKDGIGNFVLKKGIASAYNNIGLAFGSQNNYEIARSNYLISLSINEEIGFKKGIASCYNNIGLSYWNQGIYEKALENHLKSLKIRESIGDKLGIAMSLLNIGNIYLNQKDYENGLKFYLKSLKMIDELSNKNLKASVLNNIGNVYFNWHNYEKSLDYNFKSLKLREELGDKNGIADSYGNMGEIYFTQAKAGDKTVSENGYKKALENYSKSLKIYLEIGNVRGIANNYLNIANVYFKQNKKEEALDYAMKARSIYKKIGFKEGIRDAYSTLAELYESKGDYKRSMEYHKLLAGINDSLLNEKSSKQITEMNTKYDSEKKDKEIQLLNKEKESQANLATAEKRKQQVILFSVSAFALLLMGFAMMIYRSFREKQLLNKELEKLSIVASETDNGVLICGSNGEIEWCNEGLTRLLGYTLEEIKQRGDTLEEASASPEIKSLIHQSIKNKKSSVYQTLNIAKNGKQFWTQSTLTPILDKKGNVKKLVVIDTDISERKKIEEQLGEQNTELEKSHKNIALLSEIGKEITTALSIEKIIEKTYENVNKLIGADVFCIGIHNKIKNTIDFPGFIEKGKKYNSSYGLNDNTRLPVVCFKQQQEILINDLQKEYKKYIPYIPAPIAGESPESIIYIPLFSKEKIIGVITVERFHKNAYTNYHLDILRNLAVYVAIAIENARLYENLEEKVKERTTELLNKNDEIEKTYNNIKVLSEIGQQLTSTLNFEDIFSKLHENVNRLMDAETFGIRIYHPENNTVEIKYEFDKGIRDKPFSFAMDDDNNLSVWCIKNKMEIFLNDTFNEYKKYVNEMVSISGDMPHSLMFCPMILKDNVIGVITVQSYRKNRYTKQHLDVLRTLANYTAIALENARLYDNMEGEVKARTVEIEQQKEIVEKKNLKIIDSITYARQIQQSILMEESEVRLYIPDSFIYYQPKDIVSGDFYWFSKVNDKLIMAAIDCTGHGVPGAFMSMIGNTLLNQIVNQKCHTKPSEILQLLNLGIYEALHQKKGGGLSHDGMDVALCCIDYSKNEVYFAGAQNPLYVVTGNNLEVIKGDMNTIGGGGNSETGFDPSMRTYTNHIIPIKKGMSLYLFSDGYMDQFGKHDRKKFGIQQFKDLVLNNQHLDMQQQKVKIVEAFEDWKGNSPQIDDLLVMGLRL